MRALDVTGGLDAFLLLGAFALSWLIGVLVPLAPGGLGLRDGALVGALAAAVGAGPATALALVLRLGTFAGELLAAALAELAALALARRAPAPRRRPPPAPRSPSPTAAARSSSCRPTRRPTRCRGSSSASPPPAWSC